MFFGPHRRETGGISREFENGSRSCVKPFVCRLAPCRPIDDGLATRVVKLIRGARASQSRRQKRTRPISRVRKTVPLDPTWGANLSSESRNKSLQIILSLFRNNQRERERAR